MLKKIKIWRFFLLLLLLRENKQSVQKVQKKKNITLTITKSKATHLWYSYYNIDNRYNIRWSIVTLSLLFAILVNETFNNNLLWWQSIEISLSLLKV